MTARPLHGIFHGDGYHWVGDGFHVTQVFPGTHDLQRVMSPFLLMDYHAPYVYSPTDRPRGVGAHPHRGFETVTVAFEGKVAHHDSTGGGGVIGPGDVQWMTAAGGILHKEYHEAEWAKQGGTMHMMQLWVNLPAAHKLDTPGYQPLLATDMGRLELADGAGTVSLVAGSFQGTSGPARTVTPIDMFDVTLTPGGSVTFEPADGWTFSVFVVDGSLDANGAEAKTEQLVVFEQSSGDVTVSSTAGARFLVLAGEPIDEPIASYGPFVMNTRAELVAAVDDFNSGKFGYLD